MQPGTWLTPTALILASGLLVLAGVFSDVRPASAQAQEACPLPAGVTPPSPSVTAQQVEDGSASLMDFVLAAREQLRSKSLGLGTVGQQVYETCEIRRAGSPWRAGSTYLVQLTFAGRIFAHAKDMALSDRLLNPVIYETILRASGISPADLANPETGQAALEAAAVWGQRTHEPACLPPAPASGTSLDHTVLSEYEAKRRLDAAGVVVPAGTVVAADQAAAAAAEIGYPVVVKATGLAHKTEATGVVVGLEGPEEAADAARRLAGGGGTVLVESCITGAVAELLVSVRSAPPIGMLLTLGAGGTLAELLDDTVNLLLPAPGAGVLEALRSLRIWPALAGHRGHPAAAVDAVVSVVAALGALVRDDRSIIEVEINPLMVTPHAAVAADALMLVAEPPDHD